MVKPYFCKKIKVCSAIYGRGVYSDGFGCDCNEYNSGPSDFRTYYQLRVRYGTCIWGIFGMAVSWGVKRGIYSNEAGQGTAPHAAFAPEASHPAKQGLVQAFPFMSILCLFVQQLH
jgi:hypothetical protein